MSGSQKTDNHDGQEAARWERLLKIYQDLNERIKRLDKEEKILRTKILKALDEEKMEKVNKFIKEQD